VREIELRRRARRPEIAPLGEVRVGADDLDRTQIDRH
jgi:hypothetical protein